MRPLPALLWHQVCRVATSPRWALGVLVCVGVALLGVDEVMTEARNAALSASALDVHAAVTNNLAYVGYLVLAALAFIVGDTVASDAERHYARLALARRASTTDWWLAKLGAVAAACLAMAALCLVACVLVGAARGLPVRSAPSALAVAPTEARGLGLFPPVPDGTNMWRRQACVAGYLALSSFAILACSLAVTAWWPLRSLPFAIVLVGLMADYVLVKAWSPWRVASPGLRMLEGVHRASTPDPLSFGHSIVLFAALATVAACFGGLALGRREF
jgi:hypothetical protein